MFQEFALFPWKTVAGNVAWGLEAQGFPRDKIEETVRAYLEMIGLTEFRNHYPAELSGGMKQRVALARVLAFNPEVLLMDEPFGALDAQTRETMQEELSPPLERTGKTIVFVTHDIDERSISTGWSSSPPVQAASARKSEHRSPSPPQPRDQEVPAVPRVPQLHLVDPERVAERGSLLTGARFVAGIGCSRPASSFPGAEASSGQDRPHRFPVDLCRPESQYGRASRLARAGLGRGTEPLSRAPLGSGPGGSASRRWPRISSPQDGRDRDLVDAGRRGRQAGHERDSHRHHFRRRSLGQRPCREPGSTGRERHGHHDDCGS